MENRSQKALARILACGKALAQWSLILVLFAPPLRLMEPPRLPEVSESPRPHLAGDKAPREASRSRDLVRIFSIIRSHRPDAAEPEVWRISEVIHEESTKRRLDPLMVLALIRVESRFQTQAVSPAGARGIMQIMPETGKTLAAALGGEHSSLPARFTAESLDDPILNLRLGIHYLHDLKNQFQNWTATLTAYNFGPGDTWSRIEKNAGLSEEFAMLVINAYERYKRHQYPSF